MTLTCCIIDDEPHAIKAIEHCIAQTAGLELYFSESDPVKGLKILNERITWPDIIFCDIDMPEFNGMELGNLVNSKCHLVYITAHAGYAVEAFEKDAVDYLLKPISLDRFHSCISRCRNRREGRVPTVFEEHSYNSFFIHTNTIRGNYVRIPLSDLVYIRSHGNNLIFHRSSSEDDEVYMSFKDLQKMIDPKHFQRIHRSYIINVDFIKGIHMGKILLYTGEQIDLTPFYRKEFFKNLGSRVIKSSR